MLQAKELRFGNKVCNPKGEVVTVQQILSHTVIYDTQLNVSAELTEANAFYRGGPYQSEVVEVIKEVEYQEIQPIALTADILQKCGLRSFIREEWIIRYGNSHVDFEFTEDGLRLRHAVGARAVMKYLHQLQNFFFAMTGQELEVAL